MKEEHIKNVLNNLGYSSPKVTKIGVLERLEEHQKFLESLKHYLISKIPWDFEEIKKLMEEKK